MGSEDKAVSCNLKWAQEYNEFAPIIILTHCKSALTGIVTSYNRSYLT